MMQLRQRGWWASGLCAVVALALAGCGGEDGAGGVQGAPSEAAPTPGLAGVSGDEAPLDESSVASAVSAATGVPASGSQVVRLERVTWPDGCLGLASQLKGAGHEEDVLGSHAGAWAPNRGGIILASGRFDRN